MNKQSDDLLQKVFEAALAKYNSEAGTIDVRREHGKPLSKDDYALSNSLAENLLRIRQVTSAQGHAAGLLNYKALEAILFGICDVFQFQHDELVKYMHDHQPTLIAGINDE